jgi:hypothetical protein
VGNGDDVEYVGREDRVQFIEGHDAGAGRLSELLDGHARQPSRMRNGRVVDEHVEAAQFAPNALCRGDDGVLIWTLLLHSKVRLLPFQAPNRPFRFRPGGDRRDAEARCRYGSI